MYLSRIKSLHIPTLLYTETNKAKLSIFVDSRATENFISPEFIRKHDLKTLYLHVSYKLQNVNGLKNAIGELIQYTNLEVTTRKQSYIHQFYEVELGRDNIILGYPWLAAANPHID